MVSKGERTTRQYADDFLHLLLESNFQYPVSLVNDEAFEITEDKAFRPLYTINVSDF